MKKIGLSILCITFTLLSIAQNVLTIENEEISLEEFKTIFYKNNNSTVITQQYLDEYMGLFINFKLKVKEASDLGLDTLSAFNTEFEGYRKQLAKPYLKNSEFDKNMLNQAYNRMNQDVKASHILIAIDQKATTKQEQAAYNKLLAIRSSILANTISFSDAAKKNSDDKSALNNGGDLSYFTAFMMVYDFESAAYNTAVNEISMPVKTKYGYHIIKVVDKRKAVGQVKVAHIMFKSGEGANRETLVDAENKIKEVVKLLKNGEEFSSVAARFSEDKSTANKGGVLPAFGVGKMVPEFESIAFKLNDIGEISAPFKTAYGWHIIVLLERKEIPTYLEMEPELKKKIERDSRFNLSKQALYSLLRDSYKVLKKARTYLILQKKYAKDLSLGKLDPSEFKDSPSTLFTIDGKIFTTSHFINYLFSNQMLGSDFNAMYSAFVNASLVAYEESRLELKYPKYKALLKEYREGILLFDLTNKKVWEKAVNDSLGLLSFYNANKLNYMWKKRANATLYTCIDLATSKKVRKLIRKKKKGKLTDNEMLKNINSSSALGLQIVSDKFESGTNKNLDQIIWEKGISDNILLKDGGVIIIDIHETIDAQVKLLEENRGKVIADYQNKLEQDWIKELRNKYTILVNKKLLNSLIN